MLLGFNLNSNWSWIVKTLANLVVAVFFWVVYSSWPGVLGWPTKRELPDHFYLHAVHVAEPDYVYLWGTELKHGVGQTVPRAYSLPYTAALHDKVDKASRKLRKGLPVVGQISDIADQSTEPSSLQQLHNSTQNIVFVDAPQSLIPGKN